jgi:cyclohexa-1,5-dienecarbonyl-CoA hydratase
VARITLAAPKANILDRAMMTSLVQTFNELGRDGNLKAIVLGSQGPHFSFGASIEEHLPEQIAATLTQLHELLRTVAMAPVPVIAAVRGQCLGGGFELALACDLIIAEESAQFGLPEIKLGVFPPAGAALLPVRIGASRAAEMVLTGNSWTASQAAAAGLVHRLAPAGNLESALGSWLASDFLPRSATALSFAVQAARRPVLHALQHDLPAVEHLYLNELMRQPDAVEGLLAFMEKRQPKWVKGTAA